MEDENARLKKIIGNQALELEFKTELSKKRGLRTEVQGLVKDFSSRGISVQTLLGWAGLQSSSFYYKKSDLRKGWKPSTHTVNVAGELVENAQVVKTIEKTLQQEFCCYGYHQMTGELKESGLDYKP